MKNLLNPVGGAFSSAAAVSLCAWSKRRWVLLALTWLTAMAVVAIVALLGWGTRRDMPEQIITTKNGVHYRFAGVTYGTNHIQGPMMARLVNQLPKPLAAFARNRLGTRLGAVGILPTEQPSLVVWFQELRTNALYIAPAAGMVARHGIVMGFSGMLVDQHGVEAGVAAAPYGVMPAYSGGPYVGPWCGLPFPVAPRRSRTLRCCLYINDGSHTGPLLGEVSFPNPLYGRFAQWHPEALPITKQSGDLKVRLNALRPGFKGFGVDFDADYHQPEATNRMWSLLSADLSDATGNRMHVSSLLNSARFHEPTGWKSLLGRLWPDEAAWRLKLEFKRGTGYAPEELVTFTNVPLLRLGSTDTIRLTNRVAGIQVVLEETRSQQQHGGHPNTHEFRVALPSKLEGWPANFVKLSTDTGEQAETTDVITWGVAVSGFGQPAFPVPIADEIDSDDLLHSTRYVLTTIPADVQTVNITWAVQRTRTVEFLVKPPESTM
jgi:hypothetical protein